MQHIEELIKFALEAKPIIAEENFAGGTPTAGKFACLIENLASNLNSDLEALKVAQEMGKEHEGWEESVSQLEIKVKNNATQLVLLSLMLFSEVTGENKAYGQLIASLYSYAEHEGIHIPPKYFPPIYEKIAGFANSGLPRLGGIDPLL